MKRLSALLGLGILGIALVVSTGTSQDKKDPPKTKGALPPGWKNLGLSKDQISQVYSVQSKFKSKIIALEEQIKEMKSQERAEMVKLLTPDQKDQLRKMAVGEEEVKDKKDKKDKGVPEKKDKG